jgi:hypothetical protein
LSEQFFGTLDCQVMSIPFTQQFDQTMWPSREATVHRDVRSRPATSVTSPGVLCFAKVHPQKPSRTPVNPSEFTNISLVFPLLLFAKMIMKGTTARVAIIKSL